MHDVWCVYDNARWHYSGLNRQVRLRWICFQVKQFISTHYFFEGHGSLATMTKAETNAHISAVEAYIAKQKEIIKPAVVTDTLSIVATQVETSSNR